MCSASDCVDFYEWEGNNIVGSRQISKWCRTSSKTLRVVEVLCNDAAIIGLIE